VSVESSREAFLQALESLLSAPDAAPPGINAVAKSAGLNKVLIYRYFDSWDGLLAAFAQRVNPWRDLRRTLEQGLAAARWPDLPQVVRWLFHAFLDALATSPLLQNLLRLSLVHRDALQTALERDREDEGLAIARLVAGHFPGANPDLAIVAAVVTGGLTYVLLAGSRAGAFQGLSFEGAGADALPRLHAAADTLADLLDAKLTKL